MNRRNLFQVVASTVAASSLANSTTSPNEVDQTVLDKGAVVLFQGDSITDAGRDKKKLESSANHPRALGIGYPFLIAGQILRDNPSKDLKVFNRGISGNKVPDLRKRWHKDCLDLDPALLSIMVGVNDILHKIKGRYDGTVEDYRTGFTDLISVTQKALPNTKLVICEPFLIRGGRFEEAWHREFDERRKVAADVARAAKAIWVPFQTMFETAIAKGTEPKFWSADDVHPTIAGHALMAETWRKCVGV